MHKSRSNRAIDFAATVSTIAPCRVDSADGSVAQHQQGGFLTNSARAFIAVILALCLNASSTALALDCNSNGLNDAIDIAAGTSFDCDENDVPDECEIVANFSDENVISTATDAAWSVFAADMDGDGHLDVLSASDLGDKIGWHRNMDGRGTFGPLHVITTQTDSPQTVYAADIDGDGDVDVLSASRKDNKIAWYKNIDGAGTFGSQRVISNSALAAYAVFAADLDDDGDADVLSSSRDDDTVAWYENIDGLGTFGPRQVLSNTATSSNSVYAADLNGDQALDVISAAFFPGSLSWYANTNGLGGFGAGQIIGTTGSSRSVSAADFDGDGDNDILATNSENSIAWFENTNGLGDFGPPQVITNLVISVYTVGPYDLDGDGDFDVLSASYSDNKIAWYENIDGLGTFGPQQIISTSAERPRSAYAADLDGDGDLDTLSASSQDDKIAWYENYAISDCNKNGIPDECEIADQVSTDCNNNTVPDECELNGNDCNTNGAPDECDIASSDNLDCNDNGVPDKCELADSDCNFNSIPDDCDIAGPTSTDCNSNSVPDECDLFINDCNFNSIPDDCDVAAQTSDDCNNNDVPDECEPACDDCNSNGVPDVFDIAEATSLDCNRNSIPDECEPEGNDCNSNGVRDDCELQPEFTDRMIIGSSNNARQAIAVDLDGDGDNDVLAASSSNAKIAWYENINGLGNFGTEQVISTGILSGVCVHAADVDGDGDADVLVTSSNEHEKVYWFENTNGLGDFGPRQVIDVFIASGDFPLFASDLDNDGDLDLLTALTWYGKVSWYENLDGLGNFGPEQAISIATIATESVYAADLDADGDNDVLAADGFYGRIVWFENRGGLGDFSRRNIISSTAHDVDHIVAIDLDGDYDPDILSAGEGGDTIAWYENTDGSGNFGPRQVIDDPAEGSSGVFAADLDEDGDTDILFTSTSEDTIGWYENIDGRGTFSSRQVLAFSANVGGGLYVADLDSDGDLDALTAHYAGDVFAWHEHISNDCNQNLIPDDCDIANGSSSDCNNNGTPDECEPDCNASGFPDDCDVSNLTSDDCNLNGHPDECESDCNASGFPDDCDVTSQTSNDCNFNNCPDECELFGNDCNTDGVPDECQHTALVDSLSGPIDIVACPLTDAQLTVTSSLPGLEYQWDIIGAPLVEGIDAVGTNTATLTIPNVDSSDVGTYFCEVSFGCISTVTGYATLLVLESFSIAQQPTALSMTCSGNTVAIAVTATGHELTYEWRKDGLPIPEQPGKYENVDTSVLRVVDVDQIDLAEYSCIVRDDCGGEETTTSAFIEIGDATFVVQPIGQCVTEGETASYTATADGGTFFVFRQWHKDGVPLVDGGDVSGSFTDTLTIQNVSVADEGSYSQRALTLGANCVVFSESVQLELDSCTCDTPGDIDADGDLDLVDLQLFMGCFGTNVGELTGCACANLDHTDDTIDLDDWSAYTTNLTGP